MGVNALRHRKTVYNYERQRNVTVPRRCSAAMACGKAIFDPKHRTFGVLKNGLQTCGEILRGLDRDATPAQIDEPRCVATVSPPEFLNSALAPLGD